MHYGKIIFPDNLFSWLLLFDWFFFFFDRICSLIYYYIHITCRWLTTEWHKSSIYWGIAPMEHVPHSPILVQHAPGSLYVLDERSSCTHRRSRTCGSNWWECGFSTKEDEESASKTRKAEMDLWWHRSRDKRGLSGWSTPERCWYTATNHTAAHIAR